MYQPESLAVRSIQLQIFIFSCLLMWRRRWDSGEPRGGVMGVIQLNICDGRCPLNNLGDILSALFYSPCFFNPASKPGSYMCAVASWWFNGALRSPGEYVLCMRRKRSNCNIYTQKKKKTQVHADLFCLDVADPATFLASNSVLFSSESSLFIQFWTKLIFPSACYYLVNVVNIEILSLNFFSNNT